MTRKPPRKWRRWWPTEPPPPPTAASPTASASRPPRETGRRQWPPQKWTQNSSYRTPQHPKNPLLSSQSMGTHEAHIGQEEEQVSFSLPPYKHLSSIKYRKK